MTKDVLAHWCVAGREYCLTQDTAPGMSYRIHERTKDSTDAPCWRQAICTFPQSRDAACYDHDKQALHDLVARFHCMCHANSIKVDDGTEGES